MTSILSALASTFQRRFRRRQMAVEQLRNLPDRRLLAESFIPALAARGGRILWVGCRRYTVADYPALEIQGAEVWTTDIDPKAARWARKGRHQTGDICGIDRIFDDLRFDTIVCNGVLGYGVDTPAAQQQALTAMAGVLKPGGLLLLGWNCDKIEDPLLLPAFAQHYVTAQIAEHQPRVRFDTVTHVYDTLSLARP